MAGHAPTSIEAATRSTRVAALNDAFRRSLTGGRVMITAGVSALPAGARTAVIALVQAFVAFEPGDDPYGEHDFGAITVGAVRAYWKINPYDRALSGHSPDSADPALTTLVLTIMLAEEW